MSVPQSVDASVRAERAALWLQRSRVETQTRPPVPSTTWLRLAAVATAVLAVAAAFVILPEPADPLPPTALVPPSGALQAALQVRRNDQTLDYVIGMRLQPGDRGRLQIASSSGGFLTLVRHGHDGLTTALDAVSVPGGSAFAPGEVLLDTSGGETWYVLLAADRVPASHYETLLAAGRSPPVLVAVLPVGAEPAFESRVTPQ